MISSRAARVVGFGTLLAAMLLGPVAVSAAGDDGVSTAASAGSGKVAPKLLAQSDVAPPASSFLYVKTNQGGFVREIWRSIDGTKDGLVSQPDPTGLNGMQVIPLPGCVNGRAAVYHGPELMEGVTEPCSPSPAYLGDAAAAKAVATLTEAGATGNPDAVIKQLYDLTNERLVSPKTELAIFSAASKIKGVKVTNGAAGVNGGQSLAVTATASNQSLVFDSSSRQLLGSQESSTLVTAVVTQLGSRPTG